MDINIQLDDMGVLPSKAHKTDAGYDLKTPYEFKMIPNERVLVDTGVHIEIPSGYFGKLETKSGLGHRGVIVPYGVIDSGYTGSIKVELWNTSDEYVTFNAYDKICQIIFIPFGNADRIFIVSNIKGERGDNGFGSSGR